MMMEEVAVKKRVSLVHYQPQRRAAAREKTVRLRTKRWLDHINRLTPAGKLARLENTHTKRIIINNTIVKAQIKRHDYYLLLSRR